MPSPQNPTPWGFQAPQDQTTRDVHLGPTLAIQPRAEWLEPASPRSSLQTLVDLCSADANRVREHLVRIDPIQQQANPISRTIDNMRWFLSGVEERFEAAGIQSIPPSGLGRTYVLTSTQQALLSEIENPLYQKLTELWRDFEIGARLRLDEQPLDAAGATALKESLKEKAQGELSHFLRQSPFCLWAMKQLGGHAGDTTIVRMILGETVVAPTLLGNFLDRWHVSAPVAQAHRHRVEDMAEWLRLTINSPEFTPQRGHHGRIRVLNLGCGPAREIVRWISRNRFEDLGRFSFTLQDLSADALNSARLGIEEAQRGLEEGPEISTQAQNALKLGLRYLKGLPDLKTEPFHRAYCAGLYDYLDERIAGGVTRALFHQLAPGGTMLITNVDAANPGRYAQELLINWELIYRTRDDMLKLAEVLTQTMPDLSLTLRDDLRKNSDVLAAPEVLRPGEFCVSSDKTGLNLFLWIRKPEAAPPA